MPLITTTDIQSKSYPIYLDYHSTTPVDLRVAKQMLHFMTTAFGNASSIDHTYGDQAEEAVSQAAVHIAKYIYPLKEIGQIAQKYDIPLLCDASQAVGKIPIDFKEWGITYLAISAHKLYGPKGSGALVVRKGYHLEPILFGGGHQKGLRSGTLNVPGIVGLGEACRLRSLEMVEDELANAAKRDRLQDLLLDLGDRLLISLSSLLVIPFAFVMESKPAPSINEKLSRHRVRCLS
jgi:cysteine sulfinate desulfinase/cysteine desulfurase-like protein